MTYSGSATLTVARKAPAADEVESFDDLSSLQNVRLESGQPDYQKTYLREEGDLPEGAAGGVSFTVTNGGESGNWPNLYFNAVSMTPETLRTYGSVVIPMYIGVEADSRISEIQIEVNGVRVFVPVNTWYDVVIDAAYFADNLSARILWIQNGGDGVVNAVNEVRIASVYAKASEGAPALLDMNEFAAFSGSNVWADRGMSNATKYQRSLAHEGVPDGYEIAVRLNADTADGDQWANVYARTLTKTDVQSYMEQGYVSMSFWLYVEKADTSSRQELQIKLLHKENADDIYSESNIAVGQWVKCEIALGALAERMDDSTGQVKLFWATVPASGNQPIEALWMTGLTFENPGRIDIVDFSSDATAKFDTATSGDKPNVTASWVEQSALPEGGEKPENGAVKLTTQERSANVRVLSQIDKQLYRSGYKAKILVYFASESSTDIAYSMIHWASVSADQKVSANNWVEIEVPAYQDGEQNDLYDVDAWFAGGFTGWLAVASDQNVSDIYVAGVWLESPAI